MVFHGTGYNPVKKKEHNSGIIQVMQESGNNLVYVVY
jgi:hypothetical protein